MAEKKSLAARLDELSVRFDELEDHIHSGVHRSDGDYDASESKTLYCSMPPTSRPTFGPEVSAERASAIMAIGRKWMNGTNLHYFMFGSGPLGGDSSQRDVVRRAFDVWKDVGIGLNFVEVTSIADSELRIGFRRGQGSWSTVGRFCEPHTQPSHTPRSGGRIWIGIFT